ncbi:hypothetical protein ALC60_00938 [Trachymyrmex zeteki]|uniref:Uncharacterized protein n=1 Tax=Mycetomoellerius zeteki TaxID=64791 RepID=A0A151XHZ3_9HYME|nr:hypothetical protein ALC60_00938 [Trachymyrmex zeteki]
MEIEEQLINEVFKRPGLTVSNIESMSEFDDSQSNVFHDDSNSCNSSSNSRNTSRYEYFPHVEHGLAVAWGLPRVPLSRSGPPRDLHTRIRYPKGPAFSSEDVGPGVARPFQDSTPIVSVGEGNSDFKSRRLGAVRGTFGPFPCGDMEDRPPWVVGSRGAPSPPPPVRWGGSLGIRPLEVCDAGALAGVAAQCPGASGFGRPHAMGWGAIEIGSSDDKEEEKKKRTRGRPALNPANVGKYMAAHRAEEADKAKTRQMRRDYRIISDPEIAPSSASAKRAAERAAELVEEYERQPLEAIAAVATRELATLAKAVERSKNIKGDIVRDLWGVFSKLTAALTATLNRTAQGRNRPPPGESGAEGGGEAGKETPCPSPPLAQDPTPATRLRAGKRRPSGSSKRRMSKDNSLDRIANSLEGPMSFNIEQDKPASMGHLITLLLRDMNLELLDEVIFDTFKVINEAKKRIDKLIDNT